MPEQSVNGEESADFSEKKQNEGENVKESEGTEKNKVQFKDDVKELGKNFFYLVTNYYQFQLMDYYIKPKKPFENGDIILLEK